MKGSSNVAWTLVVLLSFLAVIQLSWGDDQPTPSQCQDELRQGISACMAVAMGQPPSAACCARARVTHTECVCPLVTPEVAAMLDPKRIKKLAEGCGRKIPPHFKCGSLTFP